jgi:maltose O-acetyltransferase
MDQEKRRGHPLDARGGARKAGGLVRRTLRDVLINACAGSSIVPAPLRCLAYRAYGMRIETWNIRASCFFTGRAVTIGRGSFVNYGCFFDELGTIQIGEHCQIAQQVSFVSSGHAIGPPDARAGEIVAAPVAIGAGTWIGARATILAGVTVGEGCVIAAGAVVTRNCDPNGLYAGVPACRIRDLPT